MPDKHARRLDSWKSIAGYLGRACRTVQRWHSIFGLPVHHVGCHGVVFAFTDEIDAWFLHRGPGIPGEGPVHAIGIPIEISAEKGVDQPISSGTIFLPNLADKSSARAHVEAGYSLWPLISHANLPTITHTFREAIDFDPENAEAYAGLAHALIIQSMIGNLSPASAYSLARVASESASKHDANSAEAKSASVWLKMVLERDWVGAHLIFDQLQNLESVTTRVIIGRGLLSVAQGSLQPASELLYTASQRDALSPIPYSMHCWSEYLAGKYQEVIEHVAEAHSSGLSGQLLDSVDALTWIQAERPDASLPHIERLLAEDSTNDVVRGALGTWQGDQEIGGGRRGVRIPDESSVARQKHRAFLQFP